MKQGKIEVTIGTTYFEGELSDRDLHGLKALLQTILEGVDGYYTLPRQLTAKYGSRSARFLGELQTVLGDILEVKFVPDAAPAAGEEDDGERYTPLIGEQVKRAETVLSEALGEDRMDPIWPKVLKVRLDPPATLAGTVHTRDHEVPRRISHTLCERELNHILHGEPLT